MKRILIVNNAPLSSDTGGTQIYSGMLFKAMRKKGLDVRYVGIGVPDRGTISLSGNPINHARFTARLYGVARRTRNSIVFSQLSFFNLPFFLTGRRNKLVTVLHGDNIKAIHRKRGLILGSLFALSEGASLTVSDKIIAVDRSTRDIYVHKFPWIKKKIRIIPVGVDTESFRPLDRTEARNSHGFAPNEFIIMYVGRLRNDKRLDVIIDAFDTVQKEIPDSRLVIVGKGKDEDRYRQMASGIAGKVTFLGEVPHGELPRALNCANVFTLASEYESGPLVIQEALACGIPCVSTDVGRVREFIRNDLCGRIVAREPGEFARAMVHLSETDSATMKEECRKVSLEFSFDRTMGRTLSLCKGLNKSGGNGERDV